MSNLGLHEFCRTSGIDLICTEWATGTCWRDAGEDFRIGGEQSGHTIFTDVETTGDAR
jgi:phosphoglucosamine mutase